MNVTITPTKLRGSITPPPSKSQAHRLIIAAALAEGESVISNVAFSQDIEATLNCMKALGAKARVDGSTVTVTGIGKARAVTGTCMCGITHLHCGESGSTLRFLIPVALAVAGGAFFTGEGRLLARPQKPYADLFREKGIFFAHEAQAITVGGDLRPGEYALPGDVSSQFITGLLYALPLLEGDSTVRITTDRLESADYVAMTLDALKQFGITVKHKDFLTYHIPGGQSYRPQSLSVEADWSQAGFWYAAAGMGNDVEVTGMDPKSIQGDRVITHWGELLMSDPARGRSAVSIDVSHSPDLVPPLAAWGALTGHADLYIKNAARLRIKESDRLSAVTGVLSAMGAKVTEGDDNLIIEGRPSLRGGCAVDCCNDHRIAMMAAIAATRCKEPVTLVGAECVRKSYPNFWEDYEALGGIIEKSEV